MAAIPDMIAPIIGEKRFPMSEGKKSRIGNRGVGMSKVRFRCGPPKMGADLATAAPARNTR